MGSGRAIIMAAVASLAFAAAAHAGIACLNSKPCDGRCIPYSQTCSTGRARQSKP